MKELKNLFSQQGKLSKILTDYRTREGQTEMALDINLAIQEKTSLIIEAGTGIGKTFAYLAPVLMNGKKPLYQLELRRFRISFIIEIYLF